MNLLHYLKNNRGWMLLDGLIAVVIVSIALLAVIPVFTQSVRGASAAKNRTEAIYIAQQALEQMKAQDGAKTITIPSINPITMNGITYSITISALHIDAIPHTIADFLHPYQVRVDWHDDTGGDQAKYVIMKGYYYVSP